MTSGIVPMEDGRRIQVTNNYPTRWRTDRKPQHQVSVPTEPWLSSYQAMVWSPVVWVVPASLMAICPYRNCLDQKPVFPQDPYPQTSPGHGNVEIFLFSNRQGKRFDLDFENVGLTCESSQISQGLIGKFTNALSMFDKCVIGHSIWKPNSMKQ